MTADVLKKKREMYDLQSNINISQKRKIISELTISCFLWNNMHWFISFTIMPVNIKTINRVNFDITDFETLTANERSSVKVHYRILIKIQLHHIYD